MGGRHQFTGRQIAIMFVAACVTVVIAPVGVAAASHSVVSLADGAHPSRLASVDRGGALAVRTKGQTTVRGAVSITPKLPGTPFAAQAIGPEVPSVTVPSAHRVVIQTISLQIGVKITGPVGAWVEYTSAGKAERLEVPLAQIAAANAAAPDYFATTISTDIYPDAGTSITLQPIYGSAATSTNSLNVVGYSV